MLFSDAGRRHAMNRSVLFPLRSLFNLKESEREREKKGQRMMKTMYPVPQSHVLQSPAFSMATSAFGQVYVASATTFDLHGETSV